MVQSSSAAEGLRVAEGFEVAPFAGPELADDIYCLTVNPAGQVVVSGRGYVRLLTEGKDGKAERALDFTGAPADGAMGLFWDADGSLYAVGGGGLLRWKDAGAAGRLKQPELLFKCRTGSEHAAHAVLRGPDGWLYLLCGNNTGITSSAATLPTSPVKEPVAGCVLRFPPDFKGCEILADGFRNAYGMDFSAEGQLFTFDSDNERCVGLPWYEFTRCYQVIAGGRYGWRSPQWSDTWRMPPWFADVVPPVCTLGRGSPTGVVCYKHAQFPARYRGGLFLLDWTFGRVWFVTLEKKGSSYEGKPEVFLQATGDNGLAPTAAAVHPATGDLFFSIGGRGTRGAVYRVRHPAGLAALKKESRPPKPAARSLDWKPGLDATLVEQCASPDLHVRLRALSLVRRHRAPFSPEQLEPVLKAGAECPDRLVRQEVARILGDLPASQRERITRSWSGPWATLTRHLATPGFEVLGVLRDARAPAVARVEAVRLLQRALGGLTAPALKGTVWEGYSRRSMTREVPAELPGALWGAFPSEEDDLDRELARTLALLEDADPAGPARVSVKLTEKSDPIDDIHYLIVLARLRGARGAEVTRRTAQALLALDRKVVARKITRDSNWPLRIKELHAELARKDGPLNAALLASPEFGRPDHAVFALCPGFDRRAAAERFLARAGKEPDFAWNADLVALLGDLPPKRGLPALRKLWGEHGLDEVILPALARHPSPEDRPRFLEALTSARLESLRLSLAALKKLPAPKDGELKRDEVFALVRALMQLPAGKEEEKLSQEVQERLRFLTGQSLTGSAAWRAWVRKAYPEKAVALADADGVDVAAWERRLAKVDWASGDERRGQHVYVKAACASCHSGVQALGPDLRGVTGRFSRADLFTAIVQPSKDVSPRYRTTAISTADGRSYQGLIVYEAVDSVLLQTGPGQTVRLAHTQVSERRLTATSLMPAGLLDKLSDRDIADLYAYLRSLGVGEKPPR